MLGDPSASYRSGAWVVGTVAWPPQKHFIASLPQRKTEGGRENPCSQIKLFLEIEAHTPYRETQDETEFKIHLTSSVFKVILQKSTPP